VSSDIERKAFEKRFPVPGGIFWNEVSEQYDAAPGSGRDELVEIYHGQWVAWQAAREQGAEPVVYWVLYDKTAEKKYIKKSLGDGSLAFFDTEQEAKRTAAWHGSDVGYQRVEYYTQPQSAGVPEAETLRKQADAAEEAIVCALRTVGNVDPFEVNIHKFANDYAQRLRQQAAELEAGKAGGEK